MLARLKVPALPLFVIATAFGVSSTIQAYSIRVLEDGSTSVRALLPLLGLNLVYWYVPALLAPTIMAVALRYRLGRVRWSTQVVVHVSGVLVYSLVLTSVLLATRWLLFQQDRPATYPTFWNYARLTYLTQLDFMLMTYLSVVGLAHAMAYRRQLHPHFLFNTLNTISGLMRTNVDAADQMIDHLGDLLRMTLHSSGTQEVALKRELDVLQKYLEIEQTRFGHRLRVTMNIDPD